MIKAAPWQRWISLAPIAVALALAAAATSVAGAAGLPAGLPDLPGLSDAQQRDQRSGLALHGFDPLSYRLAGKPLAGQPEHELLQDGVIWRFASQANLAAFRGDPDAYRPAFDGLDALAVARGYRADADTRFFALAGGRLVLFGSAESRDAFLADPANLARAAANWSRSVHAATW